MQRDKYFFDDNLEKKMRIGLLTSALNRPSITPLSNFIDILSQISSEIYLITGNEGFSNFKEDSRIRTYGFMYVIKKKAILIIKNFLLYQMFCIYYMTKLSKKVDFWIFFTGGEFMVLPMFIAKIQKKSVILYIPGSTIRDAEYSKDSLLNVTKWLSKITRRYSDHIIVYSNNLIKEWNLEKYQKKIIVAHRHFLDFTKFRITNPFLQRQMIIGYIGRLSGEKGVQCFVQALPKILNDKKNLRVLIGGDGRLMESIKLSLETEKITDYVDLPGWISHDDLPHYFNQLTLLVIPSYTEGLPNIMLEAMACGTPVLATPVGAIPDIIQDGFTGYIMENNSPECIIENVIRVLNAPNLEMVSHNGQVFVEENFTFEITLKSWEKLIKNL